jgi:hypothetical protein
MPGWRRAAAATASAPALPGGVFQKARSFASRGGGVSNNCMLVANKDSAKGTDVPGAGRAV